jgi:hypothetical protein
MNLNIKDINPSYIFQTNTKEHKEDILNQAKADNKEACWVGYGTEDINSQYQPSPIKDDDYYMKYCNSDNYDYLKDYRLVWGYGIGIIETDVIINIDTGKHIVEGKEACDAYIPEEGINIKRGIWLRFSGNNFKNPTEIREVILPKEIISIKNLTTNLSSRNLTIYGFNSENIINWDYAFCEKTNYSEIIHRRIAITDYIYDLSSTKSMCGTFNVASLTSITENNKLYCKNVNENIIAHYCFYYCRISVDIKELCSNYIGGNYFINFGTGYPTYHLENCKFNFLPLYCISSLDNSKGADINLDLSNTEYIINAPYCYKFADNAYIKGKIKNIIAPNDNITSYNIINTYTLEEYNDYNAPVLNNYCDDISPICRINGLFKLKETDEAKYYSYTELSCFQNIDNSINTYIGNIGYNYINNQAENYFITNKLKLFFSNYNDIRFFNDTNNIGNINLYNYIIYNTENTKTVFSFNNKNDIINIDNLLNFAITGAISNSIFVSSSTNKTININDKIVLFNNNGIYVSIPENYYIVNHFIGDVDLYLRKYKSSYSNIIIDGTITIINGNETENVENNITDITCNSLIIEDNCPIKYLINISEESINNLMNALITNTDTLKTINIYRSQYNKITEENISNVLNKNYQFAIEEN